MPGEPSSNTTTKKKNKCGNHGAGGFKSLGLSEPVLQGIARMGFRLPTPVQRKTLPIALSGVDTIVMARTGSGKTMAFLIPILERLLADTTRSTGGGGVRALILSPTRELSLQTLGVLNKFLSYCYGSSDNADGTALSGLNRRVRAIGIHGSESMEGQFDKLSAKPDIICATPGRLAHHISELPDFNLSSVQMCVVDEADCLFEMGFASQLRDTIATSLGSNCQKLLLSATLPKVLIEFTKSGFFSSGYQQQEPTVVRLDNEATISADLRMAFVTCRSSDKDAVLLHLINNVIFGGGQERGHQNDDKSNEHQERGKAGLTLIFAATRHSVEYICTLINAAAPAHHHSDHPFCTFIYGTLDSEARKANLHAFVSRRSPVLVVTDVAARGIDIPQIDHVVHYHFAPSPKLYVHRSGRASRAAGRIGYCWSLVQPDELPYMMDLHVFLGQTPMHSNDSYSLSDWMPDMVHYGCVPESVLSIQVEHVSRLLERTGSSDAESLRALAKVCANAMKQYRKTRPEASKDAVRRAKALLEGDRRETGQRFLNRTIPPHPLLLEPTASGNATAATSLTGLASAENAAKRQEFLFAMANFRPKETVFEAFGSHCGSGKQGAASSGILDHKKKGRTKSSSTPGTAAVRESTALMAMRDMRRQMRMAHDKGSSLVVAGSLLLQQPQEQQLDTSAAADDSVLSLDKSIQQQVGPVAGSARQSRLAPGAPVAVVAPKARMSRAERRKMKKGGTASAVEASVVGDSSAVGTTMDDNVNKPTKAKRGSDFRDEAYFISNDIDTREAHRSRQVEAALQPSAASQKGSLTGQAYRRIEDAMLDLVGDEKEELVKKTRMMRWDKSKRKYVQTTVGSELGGASKTKRMRLESGQLVKNDKVKLGELYEKWQKKTNRSIGRTGVFDDDAPAVDSGTANDYHGRAQSRRNNSNTKKKTLNDTGGRDKIKTSAEIKKERAKKKDMMLKNMKKSDRRVIERKQREERTRTTSTKSKKGR